MDLEDRGRSRARRRPQGRYNRSNDVQSVDRFHWRFRPTSGDQGQADDGPRRQSGDPTEGNEDNRWRSSDPVAHHYHRRSTEMLPRDKSHRRGSLDVRHRTTRLSVDLPPSQREGRERRRRSVGPALPLPTQAAASGRESSHRRRHLNAADQLHPRDRSNSSPSQPPPLPPRPEQYPDLPLLPTPTDPRSRGRSPQNIDSDSPQFDISASEFEQLEDEYYDTKQSMLETIEQGLTLNLELNTAKAQLEQILKNFIAFDEWQFNPTAQLLPSQHRHQSSRQRFRYGVPTSASLESTSRHQRSNPGSEPQASEHTTPTGSGYEMPPTPSRTGRFVAPEISLCSDDTADTTTTQDEVDAQEQTALTHFGYEAREEAPPTPDTVHDTQTKPLTRSTASASAFYPFRKPPAPRNTKPQPPPSVAKTIISDDYSISNMSEITRVSEASMREQNSRCADSGPLQSTFQYPQHSTPEKPLEPGAEDGHSAVHKLTILDGTERPVANEIDSRMETSLTKGMQPENTLFTPAASLRMRGGTTHESPDSITPLIRRALQANPNFYHLVNSSGISNSPSSPTLVAEDGTLPPPTEKLPEASREMFLQTEETFSFHPSRKLDYESDPCQTSSDSSASEDDIPQPNDKPQHKRRSGPYFLTGGMLVHQSDNPTKDTQLSTEVTCDTAQHPNTVHFSLEATRASEANTSDLYDMLPLDEDEEDGYHASTDTESRCSSRGSDVGLPVAPGQICSATESSYKESDGQHSPSRRKTSVKLRPRPRRLRPPSSSGTSFSSRSSIGGVSASGGYGVGFMAPYNSPNVTSEVSGAAAKRGTFDTTDSSDVLLNKGQLHTPVALGRRPPCMGAEMMTPRSAKDATSTPPIFLSGPSTVKKRPLRRRTESFTSPKALPMAPLEPRAQTDCDDTGSDKSTTFSARSPPPSTSKTSSKKSGSSSSSKNIESSNKSPAKKTKRKLSHKLQSLKNRFRRKSKSPSPLPPS